VFTGGEPMLPRSQPGMVALLEEFHRRGNPANFVTVETNGTRAVRDDLEEYIHGMDLMSDHFPNEWFWSVSPKLFTTSGESRDRAIKPDVVAQYAELSPYGQLKYVVNGSEETWQEVEEVTRMFRAAGCHFPVWIMGVGGTLEGLKTTEAQIADEAIQRGYNYTSRVHCHIYGNAIGK
jgi:7-carboxy-7-deazaguanine synthase